MTHVPDWAEPPALICLTVTLTGLPLGTWADLIRELWRHHR